MVYRSQINHQNTLYPKVGRQSYGLDPTKRTLLQVPFQVTIALMFLTSEKRTTSKIRTCRCCVPKVRGSTVYCSATTCLHTAAACICPPPPPPQADKLTLVASYVFCLLLTIEGHNGSCNHCIATVHGCDSYVMHAYS